MPKPPLQQVAASLDVPRALAPHLAALFADLSSLGSMPRTTARLLAEAGLRRGHRVLDLACGKGAIAVELAVRTRGRVTGLDAFSPFVEAAQDLAIRRGVDHLCHFRVADLRDRRSLPRRFDAALMLGLDPLTSAAPVLRSLVRPRGLYVMDDCFRDARRAGRAFAQIPTRDECRAFIADLGDTVIACHVPTPSAVRRLNARLYRSIRARAAALRRARPGLTGPIRELLLRQRRASTLLTGPLRPAIWVVRRGPGA